MPRPCSIERARVCGRTRHTFSRKDQMENRADGWPVQSLSQLLGAVVVSAAAGSVSMNQRGYVHVKPHC